MEFLVQLLVLFVSVAAVTSRSYDLAEDELKQIQSLVQEIQDSKDDLEHEKFHHDQHHSNDPHDHTNIQTMNVLYKHNNIGRKPIARTGGSTGSGDLLCKLVGRCGCSRGRTDIPCNDDLHGEIIVISEISDDTNVNEDIKLLNGKQDAKQNHAEINVNVEQLLKDLENVIITKVGDEQVKDDPGNVKLLCEGAKCNLANLDDSDDQVVQFLDDLETYLVTANDKDDDDDDDEDIKNENFLRCCKRCSRKSIFRTNPLDNRDEEEGKALLRCCNRCNSRNRYFRANNRPELGNERDDDDRRDRRDQVDRAKTYKINDNLDAIVVDASSLGNILQLLNNGKNYDNSNTIKDFYVRAGNTKSVPQSNSGRLLPLTSQQKERMSVVKRSRRNAKPDVERYGLPFELDVLGLGQVNP